MDYLYGKLNSEVKYREYKGSETTTATVTIDDSSTVSVDVKKVPNELTLTTINGDTYTYDGSEPASFDIRTQVTDKVEEGNNLPVTSDAVKGYVDSKAGALEYVGGEGNFTNINGGVTVKGRLNVDDGITSPTEPTASTDVANKGYVDDNFVAKVNTPAIVYATNATDGSPRAIPWNTAAVPNSVAIFDDKGCLRTGGPVSGASDYGSQCVNIRYADKTYVKKVTPTTTFDVAYIAKNDGTQSTMLISQGVYQNTLAQRGTDGRLQVGTPVGVNDATTKKYVDDSDAKKLNLTGGTITGSLAIQGDLAVTGTTTMEKAQTLAVKDSVIVTNADGAELGATLSGIAIRKDGENTYGVMYDPSGDSVKLGLGTLDAENKFTFNDSGTDGKAIATRADSSNLTDGDLVKWDDATKSLVDSGKKTDDFVEKVTNTTNTTKAYITIAGSQGTIDVATGVAANTLAQRGADGRLRVGIAVGDSDAMPKKQVEDGFVAKVTTGNWNRAYTVDNNNQQVMMGIAEGATEWTLARRYTNGRLQVADPEGQNDAVNKEYAEANFVPLKPSNFDTTTTYNTEGAYCFTYNATDKTFTPVYKNYGLGYNNLPIYNNDATLTVVTPGLGGSDTFTGNATSDTYVYNNFVVSEFGHTPSQSAQDLLGQGFTKLAYIADFDPQENIPVALSETPNAGTIALRTSSGQLSTEAPTETYHAASKGYVDDGFVPKKTSTTGTQIYAFDNNGLKDVHMSAGAIESGLAYKNTGGTLKIGTPVGQSDATTKAYVDNLNTITITAGA